MIALRPLRRRMLLAWGLALVAGTATVAVSELSARKLPRPDPLEELSYYPSGEHLRPATLGHAETFADLAWLRAIQYYGEHRYTDNRFDNMEHVFDILTSLSPRYHAAYVFGAFALAQEGGDFAAAERLMLRGLERNPTSGPLAFEAGFLYYVKPGGRDLVRAAEYFERASFQADAPPAAARFAAFSRQASGHLEAAYALWSNLFERSPNPHMRKIAEEKMKEIREALARGEGAKAVPRLTIPGILLVKP